ncbi:hypothetical protein MKW94_017854 [Papaver nudicaule]|uniref:Pentatricopeptide repeat-containing protein n=1 Tax=Papaver nudicaule TaxID=74823 RepID=A0AA41RNR9_PAPNU|nr:hypothetical protein [Papaver nudicaule]
MIQALSQTPGLEIKALSVYTLQLCSEPNDSYGRPDCFTFPSVLKACVSVFSSVKSIQQIHTQLMKLGTYSDVYVGSTLLDSYSKCNGIKYAQRVFEEMTDRNVVSWNSMISAFAKSGDVDSAKRLFEEMPEKNLVSWTSLISGYAQNGYFSETLATFENMGKAGVKPNEITLVSVISACANLGALGFGRRIHSFMEDNHYKFDLFVASSLIDMYCKCGVVQDALELYKKMHLKNAITCSSMIVGLALNGRAMEAIEIFEEMRFQGMIPNEITFIGVLCACCHAGLVEKGEFYFSSMTKEYSLVPKLQHYACIVDLLGRAGQLDQAYQFIKEMPIKPDAIVWGALLGACRIHKNNKLGMFAAQRILELDPKHSGGLVFLSNVYARMGNWDGLKKVRRMMKTSGMKKVPGKSWIEVSNVVHQFFAGDKSHHQNDKIYAN